MFVFLVKSTKRKSENIFDDPVYSIRWVEVSVTYVNNQSLDFALGYIVLPCCTDFSSVESVEVYEL